MEEIVIMDTKRFFARNDLDKKLKGLMEKAAEGDGDSQFSVANQILEIVKNPSSKLYLLWMEESCRNGCVMAQYLLAETKDRSDRLDYYRMLVDNEKTPRQVYDYSLLILAEDLYAKKDEKAVGLYEKVLEDDPRNKKACYRLAELYLNLGRIDDARKMFRLYQKLHKATMNHDYSDPLNLKEKLKKN